MLSTKVTPIENLRPLTSLRFFAAMMIVVGHSSVYNSWFAGVTTYLTHGVSFFFVLSGFILTHVYTSKKSASYGSFVRDRLARLWPVHLFAFFLLVLFVRPDAVTHSGEGFFSKPVQLVLNLSLLHSIFPFEKIMFSWNAVSWSISTELFFYLAFPFLVVNIKNNWKLKLLVAAVVAGTYVVAMAEFSKTQIGQEIGINMGYAAYSNPLFRGVEFVLGMSLWVVWDKYIRDLKSSYLVWSVAGVASVVFSIWWIFYGVKLAIGALPANPTLLLTANTMGSCWVFAILIAIVASGRGLVGTMLSNRVLVFLGDISFSIYMIHQVLLKVFAFSFTKDMEITPLMFFAALFFLASASYIMIEKPAQKLLRSNKPAKENKAYKKEGSLLEVS